MYVYRWTSSWGGSGAGGGGVTVRQLEERLNKWLLEAREQEERFLKQAQHVNAWDRVLQQGHAQVHSLRNALDAVQSDQNRLEAELDFIRGQQNELEQLLAPLEEAVGKPEIVGMGSGIHQGDRQRENMYHMAQNLDGQLRQMSEDLVKVIEHVNAINGTAEKQDSPVIELTLIIDME
ncbi:hypothetical protein HAZT_HAZT001746 [Hyalella azteca]|uniref:Nucleoporin NSP1-like C-terminal domain-containing protein n=1 Tax=Hyalella azteca TaxID=294128 RepID=A0A6A0H2A4_HYAAZ|nr:hypothetical protein HAZT_HAZT001746 [Hyalella azteca]